MSWYSSPIQPFDPVVASQQPKPPFRYMRDNFTGTGQNSYVQPPAQDQSMWQALTNVQPITQGILNQRWGYNQFASLSAGAPNRLYNFQSDALGSRYLIAAGPGSVQVFNEAGTQQINGLFTPISNNTIRSITSRNFQYFCNGINALNSSTHITGNSVKWNGTFTTNNPQCVSNIGILDTDVTQNTSIGGSTGNVLGPNLGTGATDLANASPAAPWTSPTGIFGTSSATAATNSVFIQTIAGHVVGTPTLTTNTILEDAFFTSTSATAVNGIVYLLNYRMVPFGGLTSGSATIYVQLYVGGSAVGSPKNASLICDGNNHSITFGAANDLWGASVTPAQLIGAGFGFETYITLTSAHGPLNGTYGYNPGLWNGQATAYVTPGAGSNSSGFGVGVVQGNLNGAINLTLGRTYYLVANNNITGHFGDLSPASASTGTCSNTEFTLVLATYNDPQVTNKYVLATPDGGDPSILYEVQVLVPGLTVSSWAIAANVVTFTGTWTGPQYTNGQTFVVGGLSHGSYMNGLTFTTTSSSGSTLVASFTHANDSATEPGIAGNLAFTIPNGVTLVVDNNPDPNLVTNQPLLYTDQFGNEFGVTLNDPPPAGNLLIKHQGRLWMAGVPGATHSIFFTKSVSELTLPNGFVAGKYEECWPGSNYMDVSDGAESVSGFLSDGTTLYVGTQNHIRRILGNDTTNFQEPSIIHPEVGLINQEVWQLTFMQGAPSGAIWMTPDFRVIQSDFNTYVDIGTPIQDILNNLQSTAPSLAHAAFVADGEFDLYILAVPYQQSTYCDTHLVFDLRNRQWYVWQPANGSFSLLYNVTQQAIPQWLFINGFGSAINQYAQTATTDNGTAIPVTATTTWMHLGEPTRRKMINELQVYGNTGMSISVYGANNLSDFSSATNPICYGRKLKQSPFGTWNLYLVSDKTRYRYYQFSFSSSNGLVPLLGSYSISTIPLDDL